MKNRLINFLLTLIVVACFVGAGYMGWLFFQEKMTTHEASEDTQELRAAVVQTVSQATVAAETMVPVTMAPSVGETSPAVLPSIQTEEPESEPDEESEEDDVRLIVILHNQEEGFDVLSTPDPSMAPSMTEKPEQVGTMIPEKETIKPAATTAQPLETTNPTDQPGETPTPAVEVTPEATTAPTEEPTPLPTSTPYVPQVGKSVKGTLRMTVDFSMLAAINNEIRGWIYQEGTEINYPIVQHKDNEYYLNHLFSKSQNKTGTLFMDYGNSPFFGDMLTFVYGHNRKDNAMFASIPSYKEQAYFDAHPTMDLITPYENYLLEIFALVRISTDDTAEWHVKRFNGKDEFYRYTDKLLSMSYIQTGIEPQWGEQLIALATCTNEVHTDRYVLYARMRPVVYEDGAERLAVMKQDFDTRKGTSRIINVPGRGEMQYYAQNDPVWAKLLYEAKGSQARRNIGGGGCAPTSMSIVMANLVSEDIFWYLSYYSGLDTGMTFCQESVNQYYCNHTHAQYRLEQPWEYRRYLPLAMASFCTGNNCWKEVYRATGGGGTGSGLFGRIAQIYGFKITRTTDKDEVIAGIKRGAIGIVNVGKDNIYTGGGHYMAVVSVDDEYLYIMDPYLKENYSRTDPHHLITVVEPGLLKVKLDNWKRLCFGQFYLFEKLD